MAKHRYHQSVKDRLAESRGEMRHRLHSDSDYSDYDKRRMRERMDGEMISEDHNAPANLPQNVVMKYWHEDRGYMPEVLRDDINSVDGQIESDDRQRSRGMKIHKF